MGYYWIYGVLLLAPVFLIFSFGMVKFPKRNVFFAFCFIYIYFGFMIFGIMSYIPSMHNAHVSFFQSRTTGLTQPCIF